MNIVWLRHDLRIDQNPALSTARSQRGPVLALYCHDAAAHGPWPLGGAARWWLHHSLTRLADELDSLGIPLHCVAGPAGREIPRLARQLAATNVFWSHRYHRGTALDDQQLAAVLRTQGIGVHTFHQGLFLQPPRLLNGQGHPYRVFSAFWRKLRPQVAPGTPIEPPAPQRRPTLPLIPAGPDRLKLLDRHPWYLKLHAHWQPGEATAQQQLETFITGIAADYDRSRDRPGEAGTSRLSPHLRFGEITPQQILAALMPLLDGTAGQQARHSAERYLTELGWREFAHYLLWHFPQTETRSLDTRYDEGFWTDDTRALRAWTRGETGIELVDAGMRELWETGWMHNRIRMVVASFLTKNLGLHWRHGAEWFWETLVDADLANNTLGWQWTAGCGVDAAPYFRIFNPDTQAKRFDAAGTYRSSWLPAPSPPPITDLAASRQAALSRYRERISGRQLTATD